MYNVHGCSVIWLPVKVQNSIAAAHEAYISATVSPEQFLILTWEMGLRFMCD